MTIQNPDKPITKQDLADFYGKIQPYLGGVAEAGFTPVGTVIAVMGTTAPANYLACDGTVYNISDYVELSDYFYQQFGSKNFFGGNGTTTFAVPDLRGEFLRGTGTNSHTNQGSGANVGVHQDSTEITIIQAKKDGAVRVLRNNENDYVINHNPDSEIAYSNGTQRWSNWNSSVVSTGNTYDMHTIRPTNTSVLYCIATKDIYLNPSLDYSTEEKVVGKWIDGSYIYQKTIDFGSLPNNGSKSVAHGISNLKRVINFSAIMQNTSSLDGRPIPIYAEGNNNLVSVEYNDTNINIYSSADRRGYYGYVTIQYTKNS